MPPLLGGQATIGSRLFSEGYFCTGQGRSVAWASEGGNVARQVVRLNVRINEDIEEAPSNDRLLFVS